MTDDPAGVTAIPPPATAVPPPPPPPGGALPCELDDFIEEERERSPGFREAYDRAEGGARSVEGLPEQTLVPLQDDHDRFAGTALQDPEVRQAYRQASYDRGHAAGERAGYERARLETDPRCPAKRTAPTGVVARCMYFVGHGSIGAVNHWAPTVGPWDDEHEDAVAVDSGQESHEPGPTLVIDFEAGPDVWVGTCSGHGEVAVSEASSEGHDIVVRRMTEHEKAFHGGDGIVPPHLLINGPEESDRG